MLEYFRITEVRRIAKRWMDFKSTCCGRGISYSSVIGYWYCHKCGIRIGLEEGERSATAMSQICSIMSLSKKKTKPLRHVNIGSVFLAHQKG